MEQKPLDIVLFGATSFVGQILTKYLAQNYGLGHGFSWGIAGRSASKLQALKDSLGEELNALPVMIADSNDEDALRAICQQTSVVVSTVGPYALYGEPLVKACVDEGIGYCDLTGETQWIAAMIRRYESDAKKSGARIVHCCGFDSIPSDLGVYFLQKSAKKAFKQPCSVVHMRVEKMRGEFSGGTVASILNVVKEASKNPELRKELANPYALCSVGHGFSSRQVSTNSMGYDADFKVWKAPFLMAGINTRVVHRSNQLLKNQYTNHFLYDEAMLVGKGLAGGIKSCGVTGAMGGFMIAAAIKPTRWLLENYIVPKPGEGPSSASQEKGFYALRFIGKTDANESISVKVTGDRDPGYGSTAKMLAQAAICLALDMPSSKKGGFWTPASLLGDKLIKRLVENAGLTFEVSAN